MTNQWLDRLKRHEAMQKSKTRLGRQLTKLPKLQDGNKCGGSATNSVSSVSSHTGHVFRNEGIPHPIYGHDEFSLIRLPRSAIKPR